MVGYPQCYKPHRDLYKNCRGKSDISLGNSQFEFCVSGEEHRRQLSLLALYPGRSARKLTGQGEMTQALASFCSSLLLGEDGILTFFTANLGNTKWCFFKTRPCLAPAWLLCLILCAVSMEFLNLCP